MAATNLAIRTLRVIREYWPRPAGLPQRAHKHLPQPAAACRSRAAVHLAALVHNNTLNGGRGPGLPAWIFRVGSDLLAAEGVLRNNGTLF